MDTPVLVKLKGFEDLDKGWAYGEGGPIDVRVINDATRIICFALSHGLDKMDVFPGLAGEAAVSIYDDRQYLELIVEADRTVTFVQEIDGEETVYKEDLSLNDALFMLQQYCGKKAIICAISEYFTKNTMTECVDGSLAWLSSPLITVASRFLEKDVQKARVVRSVSTSPTFIQQLPGLQLCTG